MKLAYLKMTTAVRGAMKDRTFGAYLLDLGLRNVRVCARRFGVLTKFDVFFAFVHGQTNRPESNCNKDNADPFHTLKLSEFSPIYKVGACPC